MKLIFWHNIISPHQAAFMRELAESGHEVLVVSAEAMSAERRKLGWDLPSLGPAQVILNPSAAMVAEIVAASGPCSIHLIAGARGTRLGRQVALDCRASGSRVGIITEAPDMRGTGGLARWVKYSWERATMGKHFDFILAMGQMGVRWFQRCGYAGERIFPFVYVTERVSEGLREGTGEVFHFLFVGQLISLKGVDLLLHALAHVPGADLTIVGEGPELDPLRQLAVRLGIADRVFWLGQMDRGRVQTQIFKTDVLVLPSRKDGWGAVVNEALMAGTPVICSTACGASELIRHPWLGTVFKNNHIASLQAALSLWSNRGKASAEFRQRIQRWSQNIEAPRVARYIEEVLTHVYASGPIPEVPWRR